MRRTSAVGLAITLLALCGSANARPVENDFWVSRVPAQASESVGKKTSKAVEAKAENGTPPPPEITMSSGLREVVEEPPVDQPTVTVGRIAMAYEVSEATPLPSESFLLHSKPTAKKTIYLDFDGATISGTDWNILRGIPNRVMPGYDTDGNFASFNISERNFIISVWQGVSEDYAPFDVDITTEQPPLPRLTRSSLADDEFGTTVVQSPDNWLCGATCGGIAFVDSFTDLSDSGKPAFSLSDPSKWWHTSPADIAMTMSHEAGHNLGLHHDGTSTVPYYSGNANWVPIMGSAPASVRPLSQWSMGSYAGANNQEDDIAIIGSKIGFSSDDNMGASSPVLFANDLGPASASGTLENQNDKDGFLLYAGTSVDIAVQPENNYPNIDLQITLYSASCCAPVSLTGGSIYNTSNDPQLDARINTTISPGWYYAEISVGSAFFYPKYGSIGKYNLTVQRATVPATPIVLGGLDIVRTVGVRYAGDDQMPVGATGGGDPARSFIEVENCSTEIGCRIDRKPVSVGNQEFRLEGVRPDLTYSTRIRRFNGRLYSVWSNPIAQTTTDIAEAPRVFVTDSSSSAVSLNWQPAKWWGTALPSVEIRVRNNLTLIDSYLTVAREGPYVYAVPDPNATYEFTLRYVQPTYGPGRWSNTTSNARPATSAATGLGPGDRSDTPAQCTVPSCVNPRAATPQA
jgi:hypothetical protein